jgi:hypothetical protein
MEPFGFLMMARNTRPKDLTKQARIMVDVVDHDSRCDRRSKG